jgi:hypothetical protein
MDYIRRRFLVNSLTSFIEEIKDDEAQFPSRQLYSSDFLSVSIPLSLFIDKYTDYCI